MSIIGELKVLNTTVTTYTETLQFYRNSLEDIEKKICQIDPKLLGKARYKDSAHWWTTCKVYDFCYFIKDLFFHGDIRALKASKAIHDTNIAATEKQRVSIQESVNRLTAQVKSQAAALQTTLDGQNISIGEKTQELKTLEAKILASEDKRTSGFVNLRISDEALATLTLWLNQKTELAAAIATLQAQTQATQAELQPLVAYSQPVAAIPQPIETPVITYDSLSITDTHKEKIHDLIPSVASDGIFGLIKKYFTVLLPAKAELRSLHPLKSLGFILGNTNLRNSFLTIASQNQRWIGCWGKQGFKLETAEKLQHYHTEGTIIPCLPGFSKSLGLKEAQEQQLIDQATAGKWEEFMDSLVEIAKTLT